MNTRALHTLMELDDRELADVLEHVLERRAIGFAETFSTLAPHEQLLANLRATVATFRSKMVTS